MCFMIAEVTLEERMKLEPREFVKELTRDELQILDLRLEVREYHRNFGRMREDLQKRLAKRPYVGAVVKRIKADLPIIERLEAYEREHKTNLLAYPEVIDAIKEL